jgi:hypothetical protein
MYARYLGLADEPHAVVVALTTLVTQHGAGVAKNQVVTGEVKIRAAVADGRDRSFGGLDSHGDRIGGGKKVRELENGPGRAFRFHGYYCITLNARPLRHD